jgi:hypothetical protein
MKYEDVQVGMHVFLKDGYEEKFKGCVGRVIAKRIEQPLYGGILLNFDDVDCSKRETSGHYDDVYPSPEYIYLPEALVVPKKKNSLVGSSLCNGTNITRYT